MPYQYDVFISYSSSDKPWALKLSEALVAKGLNPFIDKERLEVGKPWEKQLREAVEKSQHLVALWSNYAKNSDWVQKELALFETINAANKAPQRLILINLEGQNTAYAAWQMIDDLKAANAYANGIGALDAALWQDVIRKVARAIHSDDASIPIPVAILTMTQSEVDTLEHNAWNKLQDDLGITKASLAQHYGTQRTDWHPFGSPDGIWRILEKIMDEINREVKNLRFRWELVGDDFWNDDDATRRYAANFLSAPMSLVVIDPIALYKLPVYRRLMALQDCFENDKSAIMVLPPFPMPDPSRNLRRLVRTCGQPVFDPYYEPQIPPKSKLTAHCGMSLGDEMDIKRLLLCALGYFVLETQPAAMPAYMRV
jgi:hypothetical protein